MFFLKLFRNLKTNDSKPEVSPLYYKNSIIKVLFDYIKYLIVYQNIIIIIHIQQHLIWATNNKLVKRDSQRLGK